MLLQRRQADRRRRRQRGGQSVWQRTHEIREDMQKLITTILAALLLAFGAACATGQPAGTGEQATAGGAAGDGPTGCEMAGAELEAGVCQNVPEGYGTTKERPLEYGTAGGVQSAGLGFGRLICPDGGRAETRRLGSVGEAPAESESEPSGEETLDVLDLWLVSCPSSGMTYRVYHNMYRCGSPCPPAGLRWRSIEAGDLLIEASKHLDEERYGAALEAGATLYERYPELNDSLTIYAAALLMNGKIAELRGMLTEGCEEGDGYACLWLANMYRHGRGVAESRAKARELLAQSCEASDARGCLAVAKMESMGEGGASEVPEARAHFVKACRGGMGEACTMAASMLEKGIGGEAQPEEAAAMLKLGCELGSEKACERRP